VLNHRRLGNCEFTRLTMSSLSETWRSFWHTITTNDRHASYNSPYRTGDHVPLPQSRTSTFGPTATSAIESRVDLGDETSPPRDSHGANGFNPSSTAGSMSPNSPYSPGMRSAQRRVSSMDRTRTSNDKSPAGEIQMQNFADGLPPPPPVFHSWQRIERWLEDNFNELFCNVCEPATGNDVNELELELDCTLPQDVRESLQVHDGQERGGRPTGLIFGTMLLDCEEIVEEWQNWKAVNAQYLETQPSSAVSISIQPPSSSSSAGGSSASSSKADVGPSQGNGVWKEKLLGKQDCQPPNSIQKAYAHSSWIPLIKDWGGNCIAVDLAPGPAGRWGQVIVFGRDYDCKYVLARSWGAFLANFADDLNSGPERVFVDEESGDLRFLPFKKQSIEPPYFEVLRWRCDQRHGRRQSTAGSARSRASNGALRINPNASPTSPFDTHHNSAGSPYASPPSSAGPDMRGRSPQRSNGKSPMVPSPMRSMVSSPLARVAEETPAPLSVRTDSATLKSLPSRPAERLVSVDTPGASGDFPATRIGTSSNVTSGSATPTASASKSSSLGGIENIQIVKNDENVPPAPTSNPATHAEVKEVIKESDQDKPTPKSPMLHRKASGEVAKRVEQFEKSISASTSPTTAQGPISKSRSSSPQPSAAGATAAKDDVGELKTVEI
jgi:cell wall assembly regulator SMI1